MNIQLPNPNLKVPTKPSPPKAPHGSKKPKRPKHPRRPLSCIHLQLKKAPINTAKISQKHFRGEDIPSQYFFKNSLYSLEFFLTRRKALSVAKHRRANLICEVSIT